MPGRNYMFTGDFVDEISRDKLAPAGSLGYSDLDIVPLKVTEGLPIEAIRYQRTGDPSWSSSSCGCLDHVPTVMTGFV